MHTERLIALQSLLRSGGPKRVSYAHAESGVQHLAAKLVGLLDERELADVPFVAIPRGGLIVLGLLAYALDLNSKQVLPTLPEGDLVVVVDDCMLSGGRFAQTLATLSAPNVILATLYAPQPLRGRIAAAEPRVRACVSAFDLPDFTPAVVNNEPREAWEAQWLGRLEGVRYWFGQPQPLAFPWSEPDRPFWNPELEDVDCGWLFVSPHRCLRNRALIARPLGRAALAGPIGPLRIPKGVVVGNFEDELLLCRIVDERVAGFDGSGADMFRALAVTGDVERATGVLAARYDAPRATLESDVRAFAQTLIAEGWLSRDESAGGE